MSQFTNATKSTGINITEATPVDDRLFFASLADLLNQTLVVPSALLPVLHDSMKIHIKEPSSTYIWKESAYGALGAGHTYPAYATNVRGQNYANKTYNFVLYEPVAKYKRTFTDVGAAGLVIAKSLLPDHILSDLSSIVVNMKSSWDSFSDAQVPSYIEIGADDITIILDPKPDLNEEFNITLS
jgi:hypothetical protein